MAKEKTSNFKETKEGDRRPLSIKGDEMDVAKKAALKTPENTTVNEDGEFEGGGAE